ncbi:gamma-butyrobetaine dioxygenase-like isoform X2 [Acanthaster planci]|nr:gamma-butyrobetaine dioxygenase-like isoform X2 [Acanthaster planci]
MASTFVGGTLARFFSRVQIKHRRVFSMFDLTRSTLPKENAGQPPFFCHSFYQQETLSKASAKLYCTQSSQFFTVPPQPLTCEAAPADPGKNGCKILTNVEVDTKKKQLLVSWEGGAESQTFPFVWLRDHCHCPECFHPAALSRLPSAQVVNADVAAESAEISADGRKLSVQWDDDHQSQFSTDWLRFYRFEESGDDQLLDPKLSFWGASATPHFSDFGELLADDRALYVWLVELVIRGMAVVRESPAEVGQLQKLAKRVAYLQPTCFGNTFQVKNKYGTTNIGYTTGALKLHNDLTYYLRQPGIIMLHCIEQAEGEGGENLISDGFKVAMDLKEIDPEAFRLLTTYSFEYSDKGIDCFGRYYTHTRRPVIKLNERGNIETIAISNHSRDPMLRVPVDQVLPIYRALEKYFKMLQQPENMFKYKMKKGDILSLNNWRVLHGRSSFQLTEAGGRHVEGGYLDWDEVNSRLRVLTIQFGNKSG